VTRRLLSVATTKNLMLKVRARERGQSQWGLLPDNWWHAPPAPPQRKNGRASTDLRSCGSFARRCSPNSVQPLADLSEVLIQNLGNLIRLSSQATRLITRPQQCRQ
jgi:hypothetical protein